VDKPGSRMDDPLLLPRRTAISPGGDIVVMKAAGDLRGGAAGLKLRCRVAMVAVWRFQGGPDRRQS
jgi:hypothetical protein